MLPPDPSTDGAEAGQRTLDALRDDPRPTLVLWGAEDPIIPLRTRRGVRRGDRGAGAGADRRTPATSSRRTRGAEIGARIAQWLTASSAR